MPRRIWPSRGLPLCESGKETSKRSRAGGLEDCASVLQQKMAPKPKNKKARRAQILGFRVMLTKKFKTILRDLAGTAYNKKPGLQPYVSSSRLLQRKSSSRAAALQSHYRFSLGHPLIGAGFEHLEGQGEGTNVAWVGEAKTANCGYSDSPGPVRQPGAVPRWASGGWGARSSSCRRALSERIPTGPLKRASGPTAPSQTSTLSTKTFISSPFISARRSWVSPDRSSGTGLLRRGLILR